MARMPDLSKCPTVASASRRWLSFAGGTPTLLLVFLSVGLARADVINLKDGSKVEGTVRRSGDGWVVKNNGRVIQVAADQVESIELIPATNPSEAVAQVRLTSLQRSLESLSDLKDIISRVQRFVDQGEGDAATKLEAKKNLAVWKDRLAHQMVKVGPTWVLPAERDRLVGQADSSIETARQFMKQGRTKEAEPLLAGALDIDPQNPAGNYLSGLLRAQQDQLPAARKAFESVDVVVPNHGPTLNNLAIVQWRQGQFTTAMNNFDEAMLALPVNPLILENVGGAIEVLPLEFQGSLVAAKAIRHFQEQSKLLADRMARQGLHRFGSLWVTDEELAQMKVDEKQALDRLDQLAGDFDRTKQQLKQLDQQIADVQAQIHEIGASETVFGSGISDARRRSDRSGLVGRLDMLKKQADDLEASRPSNKNRGLQIMFGPEAAPVRVAVPVGK